LFSNAEYDEEDKEADVVGTPAGAIGTIGAQPSLAGHGVV